MKPSQKSVGNQISSILARYLTSLVSEIEDNSRRKLRRKTTSKTSTIRSDNIRRKPGN